MAYLLYPRALYRCTLILLLVGLLLPLQSSLMYARSLTMLMPLSAPAISPMKTLPAVHQHVQHQADHHLAHDHTSEITAELSTNHHVNERIKPCHSDQQTGKTSHDCAKCCLIGAAAPPPNSLSSQNLTMTRSIFITPSYFHSGFIPDGPERPPRTDLS
jgi:hypothetical protein